MRTLYLLLIDTWILGKKWSSFFLRMGRNLVKRYTFPASPTFKSSYNDFISSSLIIMGYFSQKVSQTSDLQNFV